MNYSQYITAVCGFLEYQVADATSATPTGVAAFDDNWPQAVAYTENRMQRDLDFLNSVVTQTGTMTLNNRTITYPTTGGAFVVVEEIIPVIGGVRQTPLQPVSRAFLDYAYPAEASLGATVYPEYWCPKDGVSALVGPAPPSAISFDAVGTIRFTPLSNTNTTNFLSTSLPDLYLQASLCWWGEFQRDADMAGTANTAYAALLSSAQVEESRKKFANMFPSPSRPTGLTSQAA